jgi:hypothetical protein
VRAEDRDGRENAADHDGIMTPSRKDRGRTVVLPGNRLDSPAVHAVCAIETQKMPRPDLDEWLPQPVLRVEYRRESRADASQLWEAARTIKVSDTALLGRLVRLRIPGVAGSVRFDDLFRQPPFTVLEEGERWLVSGLVGRIWTLRRDYPQLATPADFREWSTPGTARVVFANWIDPEGDRSAALNAEIRVQPIGVQGRLGVGAVRPLVAAFGNLVGSEGIAAAVRRAEEHLTR